MNNKLILIAGPCVIESEEHAFKMASEISRIVSKFPEIEYYFKASFDKANRSSITSFRGVGVDEAKRIFKRIKDELGLKILTDVHTADQPSEIKDAVDVLQIPAFLCRQTDLLLAASAVGKIVNIKKGQFVAPDDMKHAVSKTASAPQTWLTERGTCFGYNNLVVDMRSFPMMKKNNPECPIIFDATHSAQLPGGGLTTGGLREYIPNLARAAIACGVDGLFMEVHDNPEKALSDSTTQFPLDQFEELLTSLLKIREAL